VVPAFNPNTQKMEARGQLGLQSKTLSQKIRNKYNKAKQKQTHKKEKG
jgi:hypothetical protein